MGSSCSSSSSDCCNSTPCGSRKYEPPPMPIIPVSGLEAAGAPDCNGTAKTFEALESFVVPAVDSSVPVTVCDSDNWPVGFCVFVSDGTNSAHFRILSGSGESITLQNNDAEGNATPGTVLSGDIVMTLVGPCPEAPEEACQTAGWVLGEAATIPADGESGTIFIEPCMGLQEGQNLFIEGWGWVTVISITETTADGVEIVVESNRRLSGADPGDVIPSGSYVIADEPQTVTDEVSASSFFVRNGATTGPRKTASDLASVYGATLGSTVFDRLDPSVGSLSVALGWTSFLAAANAVLHFSGHFHFDNPSDHGAGLGAPVTEAQIVLLRRRGSTDTIIAKGSGMIQLAADCLVSLSATVEVETGDHIFLGWTNTASGTMFDPVGGWPLENSDVEFSFFSGHLVSLV